MRRLSEVLLKYTHAVCTGCLEIFEDDLAGGVSIDAPHGCDRCANRERGMLGPVSIHRFRSLHDAERFVGDYKRWMKAMHGVDL